MIFHVGVGTGGDVIGANRQAIAFLEGIVGDAFDGPTVWSRTFPSRGTQVELLSTAICARFETEVAAE